MPEIEPTIKNHYSSGGLMDRIQQAALAAGLDWNALTPADLAPIDQFHIRGREATLEMIALSGFTKEMRILDVGCGIGGPARTLSAETGCEVHGIDLTEEFVEVAQQITVRSQQQDKVTFNSCSALQLPIVDAQFYGAWMQHVNMNIADKVALFAEIARVLKPGSRLAIHEVLADLTDQPHFPVPWATSHEGSYLCKEEELRSYLDKTGFQVLQWQDVTAESADWFGTVLKRVAESGPPKLGLSTLLGPSFGEMAKNTHRSLVENRVKVVMALAEKA